MQASAANVVSKARSLVGVVVAVRLATAPATIELTPIHAHVPLTFSAIVIVKDGRSRRERERILVFDTSCQYMHYRKKSP